MRRQRAFENGVAVGWALRDQVGADVAAGARTVVDDNGLTPGLAEFRADGTRHDVERTARWERHDQADGLVRIALPLRNRGQEQRRAKNAGGSKANEERRANQGTSEIGSGLL